jgi:hypothetical protein
MRQIGILKREISRELTSSFSGNGFTELPDREQHDDKRGRERTTCDEEVPIHTCFGDRTRGEVASDTGPPVGEYALGVGGVAAAKLGGGNPQFCMVAVGQCHFGGGELQTVFLGDAVTVVAVAPRNNISERALKTPILCLERGPRKLRSFLFLRVQVKRCPPSG